MRDKKTIDPGMVRQMPDAMTPKSENLPAWEYRSELGPRLLDISSFGAQGWELVSVIPQPADQAVFYFRRKKL